MIVREPPYELVALFADQDAQKLFEALIERGQERRCMRAFRWRSLVDARHGATTCRQPDATLRPFLEHRRYPKELLHATIEIVGLRRGSIHYETLGKRLSIGDLKRGDTSARIAEQLVAWFPP